MYAIVETGGKQYKVAEGDTITVDRLEAEEGKNFALDNVLMISTDKDTKVGTPTVKGAKVTAKVVAHTRGDKVITFKMRRRRRTRRRVGYRHSHTTLEITKIKG